MRFPRLLIVSFAVLFIAVSLVPVARAGADSIKIVDISPDPAQPLKVGQNVTFKVKVKYMLTEGSGSVALVVQKGESGGGVDASLGHSMEVITKGEGNVVLEWAGKVPDTKAIQIFTPLSAQGQGATTTVDSRYFKVQR